MSLGILNDMLVMVKHVTFLVDFYMLISAGDTEVPYFRMPISSNQCACL